MDYQDYSFQEPEKKKGVPTWVWIVGGLIGLFACCAVIVPIVGVTLLGDSVNETFESIISELGTPTADSGSVVETPVSSESSESVEVVDVSSDIASEPAYEANFDRLGTWPEGEIADPADEDFVGAAIGVNEGVYDFQAYAPETIFWVTGGESFGDGIYEVTATAVEGPVDNGFGLLLMLDDETDNFYAFEISSDGYVWIGFCESACQSFDYLVGDGWFESSAVNQGLNSTNKLTAIVEDGNFTFFVNDQEVGRSRDSKLTSGDIGMFVDTQSEGDVRVYFDDFTFTPFE